MVTFVTENEMSFDENAYYGMTLSEAMHQFEIDNINAVNEFKMDLLLAEHAYLYENGVEVSYVDEAGDVNENGHSLKEKVANAIATFSENFSKLMDKLIVWIMERVDDVKEFFAKRGLSKDVAKAAVKYYGEGVGNEVNPSHATIKPLLNGADSYEYIANLMNQNSNRDVEYNNYVASARSVEIDAKLANEAYRVIYDVKRTIITDVYNTKKDVVRANKEMIKKLTKADPDANVSIYEDMVKRYNARAKTVVSLYHTMVNNYISVLKAVVANPDIQARFAHDKKQAIEDRRAANSAKRTENRGKFFNRGSKKVAHESYLYDGDYFNV